MSDCQKKSALQKHEVLSKHKGKTSLSIRNNYDLRYSFVC